MRRVDNVAFSPDGRIIVATDFDGALAFWESENGLQLTKPAKDAAGRVVGIGWSSDGKRLVAVDQNQRLRSWNAITGQPLGQPTPAADAAIQHATFSPDGQRVVTFDHRGNMVWRDGTTGQALGEPVPIGSLARAHPTFTSDGKFLATIDQQKLFQLWDRNNRRAVGERRLNGDALSLAVSSQGRIALGGVGHVSVIDSFDAKSAARTFEQTDSSAMMSLSFSHDDSRIVAGSNLGPLRMWDTATGQSLTTALQGHHTYVHRLAFSPNGGRTFVTASQDGTLRLWPAPRAWPDRLCLKLSRNMSQLQWRQWVSREIPYTCQCPTLPIAPDDENDVGSTASCSSRRSSSPGSPG